MLSAPTGRKTDVTGASRAFITSVFLPIKLLPEFSAEEKDCGADSAYHEDRLDHDIN
jgi:hypothetical protein